MSDLDHFAVKAYRDQFKFCPSPYRRREIVVTVKDLDLWKEVLANWGYWKAGKWIKWNPLNVNAMLQEYERRSRPDYEFRNKKQPQRSNEAVSREHEGLRDGRQAGLPGGRNGGLLPVRQDAGLHTRTSNQTLDEILAAALREEDRP